MKIPILYIPGTRIRRNLYIDKRLKSKHPIIPIGSDCHPANMLNFLYLRKYSLPFDWLNISPLKTFDYINDNLVNNFEFFLENISLNSRGYYIAGKYDFSEFMHEKSLNETESQSKFKRRINRFIKIIENEKVYFLHNLPVNSLANQTEIDSYLESVKLFKKNMKNNSSLHIYLRFDENFDENKKIVDELVEKLIELKINYCMYCRQKSKFGIWGTPKKYHSVSKQVGIEVKMIFPKIYIK